MNFHRKCRFCGSFRRQIRRYRRLCGCRAYRKRTCRPSHLGSPKSRMRRCADTLHTGRHTTGLKRAHPAYTARRNSRHRGRIRPDSRPERSCRTGRTAHHTAEGMQAERNYRQDRRRFRHSHLRGIRRRAELRPAAERAERPPPRDRPPARIRTERPARSARRQAEPPAAERPAPLPPLFQKRHALPRRCRSA